MKRTCTFIITALTAIQVGASGKSPAAPNLPCAVFDAAGQVLPLDQGPYYSCSGDLAGPPGWSLDDINLVQVGTLVAPMYYTMTGGDSDQDGLFEAYMYIKDNVGGWTFTYRGYENNGSHVYAQAFQNTAGLIPYAYGEIDGDGLPDVIGQWSSWVYVYESPAPGQYANTMVWQSPAVVNVTGYTAIGDLDQDGYWEIIHTSNSFGSDNRLILWENTGNNQFQEIFNQQISNNNLGTKASADFDGDGLMEVAFSSGGGDVYVFESNGNNSLQQIYRGSMNTWNAYACSYADDMDGNGRPEFICGGSDSNRGWVTQIYEATGNDSFAVRQEIVIWDGYFGVPGNTAGDYDNDGEDEFVIQCAQSCRVYEWNGQAYAEVQNIPESFGSILHGVFSYDGDNDGYDELFWLGLGDGGYWTNETILLEDEAASAPPDITITLTPIPPPPIYPPFDFNVAIQNNEATSQSFDAWIMTQLPNGAWYGPVLGPVPLILAAGATLTRTRTQNVPASAPAGTYWYVGYVGDYPSAIWDSSGFYFTKLASGDFVLGAGDWKNTGEEFNTSEKPFITHNSSLITSVRPNPFNPSTAISFQLSANSYVSLKVYDTAGSLVATLVNGWRDAEVHEVTFDGSDLPSGIYVYRIKAEDWQASRKMILLK